MDLRLYVEAPPPVGQALALPAAAARHVQTRRLQPGDPLLLFDGSGGEWAARVERIGRREVVVQVGAQRPALAPPRPQVTLALGMPANERMDWLVEKATELGATVIQPLHCARSVLRLDEERAARRGAHWRAIAAAAGEQCGRAWLPRIEPVRTLDAWLAMLVGAGDARRWLLSLAADARPAAAAAIDAPALLVLGGPEGGLSPDEEQRACAYGFEPVSLGPAVLRSETAPLALLAWVRLTAAADAPAAALAGAAAASPAPAAAAAPAATQAVTSASARPAP